MCSGGAGYESLTPVCPEPLAHCEFAMPLSNLMAIAAARSIVWDRSTHALPGMLWRDLGDGEFEISPVEDQASAQALALWCAWYDPAFELLWSSFHVEGADGRTRWEWVRDLVMADDKCDRDAEIYLEGGAACLLRGPGWCAAHGAIAHDVQRAMAKASERLLVMCLEPDPDYDEVMEREELQVWARNELARRALARVQYDLFQATPRAMVGRPAPRGRGVRTRTR